MWSKRNYHCRNSNTYSKHTNRMLYMQQQQLDVRRLQLNDPSLTIIRCGIPNNFDIGDFLVVLGQALEKNTQLRHLTLLNLNLKLADAQALAKGIGGSKLEFLLLSHSLQTFSRADGHSVFEALINSIVEGDVMQSFEDARTEESTRSADSIRVWQSMWEGLQSSQTIREHFIGTLPTEGFVRLGEALPLMQSLCKLGFGELLLTEEAAQALANGIGQAKLESLELMGCIKERSGCIRRILCQGIASSKTIRHLVLVDSLVEELLSAKQGLPSLQTLEIKGPYKNVRQENELRTHRFGSSLNSVQDGPALMLSSAVGRMTSFAQALRCNVSLKRLALKRCKISLGGVNALFVHGLNSMASLTELKLHECEIGDDKISALVENWQPTSTIQCLSLQKNIIGPSGVQALLRAARNHPNLQMLDVSNNSGIGYVGLRNVGCELVNQEYLVHLELSNCVRRDIVDRQVVVQSRKIWFRDLAAVTLLAGIKRNSHIRHINVGSNCLYKDFENVIHFYASVNMGRYLMAADPQVVALSVWSYILAKSARQEQVKLGASVMFFYLLEQPTLVQHVRSE